MALGGRDSAWCVLLASTLEHGDCPGRIRSSPFPDGGLSLPRKQNWQIYVCKPCCLFFRLDKLQSLSVAFRCSATGRSHFWRGLYKYARPPKISVYIGTGRVGISC